MYLSLKAGQWFTIGSRWVETFRKWWNTELPSMTGIRCFSSFYLWIIKLLYLFLHLLIQIWSQNHNCNPLNVFFIVLSHSNARSENGQRTVRERSEYSMTVLSIGSAREETFSWIKEPLLSKTYKKKWFIKLMYFVHIKTIWVVP